MSAKLGTSKQRQGNVYGPVRLSLLAGPSVFCFDAALQCLSKLIAIKRVTMAVKSHSKNCTQTCFPLNAVNSQPVFILLLSANVVIPPWTNQGK